MNRLAGELSPYLRQHKNNPINWFPWGRLAFDEAKSGNKPIFLSIGYSTCHWCHVMEKESFEDDSVAKALNDNFVSIKVDREERPDVDEQFMLFVQVTNEGVAGWPLTIFLTPDCKAFFGATYFPKLRLLQILDLINKKWQTDGKSISESGDRIINLLSTLESDRNEKNKTNEINTYNQSIILGTFDTSFGGFGFSQKFPQPSLLRYLCSQSRVDGQIKSHLILTLDNICNGGIHDHVGGGFHRYTVDRQWCIPHFEKMLYDQAQLLSLFSIAHIFEIGRWDHVIKKTIKYMSTCLLDSGTDAFFCAEDADSLVNELILNDDHCKNFENSNAATQTVENVQNSKSSKDAPNVFFAKKNTTTQYGDESHSRPQKMQEGAFYVWRMDEIDAALTFDSNSSSLLQSEFSIEPSGNIPTRYDPHGELQGCNVLHRSIKKLGPENIDAPQSPTANNIDDIDILLSKLNDHRNLTRSRPPRDEKILTSWNGLAISALVDGYMATGNICYLQMARRAFNFYKEKILLDGNLQSRIFFENKVSDSVPARPDDYANMIGACIDLWNVTLELEYLQIGRNLQTKMNDLFWDENAYITSNFAIKIKSTHDGAEPSANGTSARNLIRLHYINKYCSSHMRDDKNDYEWRYRSLVNYVQENEPSPLVMLSIAEFGIEEEIAIIKIHDPEKIRDAIMTTIKRLKPHAWIVIPQELDADEQPLKDPIVCYHNACQVIHI